MAERVSLSQLARMLGHNKGYIHKLKTRGVLVFDDDGFIDADVARAAIADARDPAKQYMAQVNARQRAAARAQPQEAPPAPIAAPRAVSGPPDGNSGGGGDPDHPSANATYNKARTAKEAIGARILDMELKRRAGELVERRLVEPTVFEAFRSLRDRCFAVPALCAPNLLGLTDAREIELAIADELRLAFDGFEQQTAAALNARLAVRQ